MAIYPKSITRPLEGPGAASAYGARRFRLLGVGMIRLSLRIMMIGLVAGSAAFAQDEGSPRWLERASITRAKQPDWVTPLITASANLEEAVIYDISRKIPTNGIPLVTAGSNRGIQFVPFGALQITFAPPPYQFHNDTRAKNGFGDTQFAFKYRLASSNIEHKDFAISIATGVSVPTGSYQNGQHSGTVTPKELMQSKCLNSNCTLRLGIVVSHRIALSMLRVDRAACVLNLRKQSPIREINTAKTAKNWRVNAAREWHLACT